MKSDYRDAIAELTRAGTRKFAVAKQLVQLSETQPQELTPHFSVFTRLLATENNIIKWSAIRIVANLAAADPHLRLSRILDRYLAPIPGPNLVTAANTVAGAAVIARARPRLAPRIVAAILQVEHGEYPTAECRNVAIASALKAFLTLDPKVRRKAEILNLARRQRTNTRPGVRKLAEALLAG